MNVLSVKYPLRQKTCDLVSRSRFECVCPFCGALNIRHTRTRRIVCSHCKKAFEC